jgi:peroxiredoxin
MVASPMNETTAQGRLVQLGGEITRIYPGCNVATYAYLQEIDADYLRVVNKPESTPAKAREYRCQRVERFAQGSPDLADSQRLLMEAAQDYESLGKKDDARRCYRYMTEHYPESTLGQKAAGALMRLGMGGEPIRVKLALLYAAPDAQQKDYDLASTHAPLVVVYFWSSKCPQADQDFRDLKQVTDRHQHQGVEVVFVNLDDDPAHARAFLTSRLTMGVHVHEKGGLASHVAERYGLQSLPQAMLMGKDAVLLKQSLRAAQIETEVAARIQQMQSGKTAK